MSQEPQGIADLEAFLFAASAQLPVSVQPFQLIKSADPDMADALYLSGDSCMRRAVSAALMLSDKVPGQSIWLLMMSLNCFYTLLYFAMLLYTAILHMLLYITIH